MKKLSLLLAALSVASVSYAKEVAPTVEAPVVEEVAVSAPTLKVTSVGQYIEIDNVSGGLDIGEVYLGNSIGLAFGDNWTLDVSAYKTWEMDTDEGVNSANSRVAFDLWKKYDGYSLGARWRAYNDKDRVQLRASYSAGMFSGWADLGYEFQNKEGVNDNTYSEIMPVIVDLGVAKVGYHLEHKEFVGTLNDGDQENMFKHSVRVTAPVYRGDKLGLDLEYRYLFAHEDDYKNAEQAQKESEHVVIAKAAYAVTERLTVDGYYRYDFESFEGQNGLADKVDEYYGEFYLGWTYSF